MTTDTPPETSRRVRRRDPDDQQGWGDVPVSSLEHPYIRLLQVILFALVIFLGLDRLGLLDAEPPSVEVTRITGEDPVSASASVARQSHSGGAPIVVIAGTDALADGVVATGLAGALDAPILLNGIDTLDPQILDVIRELDTEEAVLIGGTSALSPVMERSLTVELEIEVTRLAGASRFDTAGEVADLFAEQTDPATIDGSRLGTRGAGGERLGRT